MSLVLQIQFICHVSFCSFLDFYRVTEQSGCSFWSTNVKPRDTEWEVFFIMSERTQTLVFLYQNSVLYFEYCFRQNRMQPQHCTFPCMKQRKKCNCSIKSKYPHNSFSKARKRCLIQLCSFSTIDLSRLWFLN